MRHEIEIILHRLIQTSERITVIELLNSNKCDDNRTYTLRRTSKANSFVTKKSNPTEMKARIIHKNSRGKYFSKERDDRSSVDGHTDTSDI